MFLKKPKKAVRNKTVLPFKNQKKTNMIELVLLITVIALVFFADLFMVKKPKQNGLPRFKNPPPPPPPRK